jgi:hypothetical protein
MSDIEKKIFDKIPVDKLYEDLFQPGLRKAGLALETVIEFGTTILLPIKLINKKAKARLASHLKRYNEKLEKIDHDKICRVQEQIGLQIVDKLTYLNQPELSEAFVNLLTKASSFDTINLVHPAFLTTLENLCSDEAKILQHYKDHTRIPVIDIHVNRYEEKISKPDFYDVRGPKTREQLKQQIDYAYQERNEMDVRLAWNLTGIENFVKINFPQDIDIYIENLEKQGIITFERGRYVKEDEDVYGELEQKIYPDKIEEFKKWTEDKLTEFKSTFIVKRGYIEYTEFGKAFINACIVE